MSGMPATPDAEHFSVGAIECRRFVHARGRGTPTWMFPAVDPEPLAQRITDYLDGDGSFAFVYSSLLVQVGRHLALLDTGPPPPAGGERSSLRRSLAALGIRPSDIATVVLSHGHLDHLGGVLEGGEPAYGRARHLVGGAELEHWTEGAHAGGEAAALLGPLLEHGLVDPVDGEQEVLPGVRLLPTPGHTPGHLAVALTSGGEHAIYVGDSLAHEINVAEPDWSHFSDLLPQRAARSRRQLVERAARDGAVVVGSHLSTRGRVVTTGSGAHTYVVDEIHGRLPAA